MINKVEARPLRITHVSLWFRTRWVALVFGLLLLGFAHQYQMQHLVMSQHWRVWHFTIAGLGSALVLPWCSSIQNLCWKPLQSLTAVIARWSYSLYLVHSIFITLAIEWVIPHLKKFPGLNWEVAIVTCGCSFAFAAFLYRWVEKPAMNLRDRWNLSKQRQPIAGPIRRGRAEVAAI
jgi:peptidoglycan/LPS O-acetylase OafA/YrhL